MKKLILLLLIIIITGCTNYNDLTSLTIIKSIGISYNEKYTVYAQIIDYIDKDNNPMMKTIKEDGKTIKESFNNLKKQINKDIYLSHIDLLVLDNKLNDNNYYEIINYFVNNNNFRNDFYCVFSPNIKSLLQKTSYDEVEMFLKTNEKKRKLTIKNFNSVTREFLDNKTITLPSISYQDNIISLGNIKYSQKENNYVKEN